MSRHRGKAVRTRRRGGGLVEFAIVIFLCVILLLSFVEFGRLILIYNTVANSAREGVRYASVNGTAGGGRAGRTVEEVSDEVRKFARAGPLDETRLNISVAYPDGSNAVGMRVDVTVEYPYDPLVGLFPLQVNLASTSRGVITF